MKMPVDMAMTYDSNEEHAGSIAIRINNRHICISKPNVFDLKDTYE
jgi:hypothetical protein